MKEQNKKRNIVAAALAIVLAAALMIGGTFSYQQASVEESVTNTYTSEGMSVAFNNGDQTYTIVPGNTDTDNLAVIVETPVDAYVFLVVEDDTQNLVTYTIDPEYWTELSNNEDTDEESGEASNGETADEDGQFTYSVFENESVSYDSTLTDEDLDAGENITLTFWAYAISYSVANDASTAYDSVTKLSDQPEDVTVYYHVLTLAEVETTEFTISTASDLANAVSTLASNTSTDGTITLAADITVTDTVEITGSGKNITLNLDKYDLTNESGTALSVTDASVTIKGSGTISGTMASDASEYTGGAITVNGGTLTVDGATITGTDSTSTSYHAGAIMVKNGAFNFKSGTIADSTAYGYAGTGGVYLDNSTMTMSEGATISNCKNTNKDASASSYVAGAVNVANGSTFTMTGGTITGCSIANSTSKVFGTGGVLVHGGSTFNMSGGTITSCTGSCGGAVIVFNEESAFNMSGGSITSNTATYSGGAMYIYDSGAFTMSGGSITDNDCSTGKGGGIRACSGTTVTLTGGTISGNTASTGKNAYIDADDILTDSGSVLSDYYCDGTTYE